MFFLKFYNHYIIFELFQLKTLQRLKILFVCRINYQLSYNRSALTSLEIMPARRARLPKTKENSLTCARPAETIHRMCRELGGKIADSTRTAITNWEEKNWVCRKQEKEKRKQKREDGCTFIMTSVSVKTRRMVSSYSTNVGNTWRPAAKQKHTQHVPVSLSLHHTKVQRIRVISCDAGSDR